MFSIVEGYPLKVCKDVQYRGRISLLSVEDTQQCEGISLGPSLWVKTIMMYKSGLEPGTLPISEMHVNRFCKLGQSFSTVASRAFNSRLTTSRH